MFRIKANFLEHLKKWIGEIQARCDSIVLARTEEVEKELELRIHLHEPRIKRAEMDIHNVRAGINLYSFVHI